MFCQITSDLNICLTTFASHINLHRKKLKTINDKYETNPRNFFFFSSELGKYSSSIREDDTENGTPRLTNSSIR